MVQGKARAIVVLVGLLAISASGSINNQTYNFSASDLYFSTIEKNGTTYDIVGLKECYSRTGDIGAPQLPVPQKINLFPLFSLFLSSFGF